MLITGAKCLCAVALLSFLGGCASPPATVSHDDGLASPDAGATTAPTTTGHAAPAPASSSSPSSSPAKPHPGQPPVNESAEKPTKRPWSLARDGWAPMASAKVFSGVQAESYHGGCTVNFVFTNPEATRVFVGTAAPCAAPAAENANGGPASSDYCANLSDPAAADPVNDQHLAFFGPNLTWEPLDPNTAFRADARGHLVYNSNLAMKELGESDGTTCLENDFAIIEVNAEDLHLVNPSTEHWGGITGAIAAPAAPALGAKAYTVGGTIYRTRTGIQYTYGLPAPQEATRAREGYFLGDMTLRDEWTTTANFVGQCLGGDSGSPILTGTGAPFGVMEAALPEGNMCRISYLQPMLDYALTHRGCSWCLPDDVSLVLQNGTEPFKAGLLPG